MFRVRDLYLGFFRIFNMKPEILLFHPPTTFEPQSLRKAIMSPILYGYGLLHIGSHLKNLGYKVECWNIPLAYKLGFNNDHLWKILSDYNPLLIGIELNWLHLSKGALDLAKFLRNIFPEIPIIMGGVHATLFAEQILRNYNEVDLVVIGEGEKIIEDIAATLDKNGDYKNIRGTLIKNNSKIIENSGRNIYTDIDSVPPYTLDFLMPRNTLPYDLAVINTCRGPCKYDCGHCLGAKSKYSLSTRSTITYHSISWIIRQIQLLLEHVKRISIQDYIYCNPDFIIKLAKELQKEKLSDLVEYFNFALVPHQSINREVLGELAKAGVDNLDIGIESGSQSMLELLNRPYSVQEAFMVIKNSIKLGILPKTYWMITGLESQSDLDANLKFLIQTIEIGAIPKWVTPLCLLPKTQLFDRANDYKIRLKLRNFKDYMQFSTETSNKNGYYPHCITHETELMDTFDILKHVNTLKTTIIQHKDTILRKLEENKQYYASAQPKLYEDLITQRIKMSLDLIRTSFF